MKSRQWILDDLRARLKPKRFAHSLNVEETARALARRFHIDEEKAALAGLVHDCAKALPFDAMVAYARQTDFPVDLRHDTPNTLHAPAGMALARERYGIQDLAVLEAVCWHAVPRLDMTGLDMAVSLADYIEPARDMPGVNAVRARAQESLEDAFAMSLAGSMRYLLKNGLYIQPLTLLKYNRIVAGQGEKVKNETP